jgi:hypothetical protein
LTLSIKINYWVGVVQCGNLFKLMIKWAHISRPRKVSDNVIFYNKDKQAFEDGDHRIWIPEVSSPPLSLSLFLPFPPLHAPPYLPCVRPMAPLRATPPFPSRARVPARGPAPAPPRGARPRPGSLAPVARLPVSLGPLRVAPRPLPPRQRGPWRGPCPACGPWPPATRPLAACPARSRAHSLSAHRDKISV